MAASAFLTLFSTTIISHIVHAQLEQQIYHWTADSLDAGVLECAGQSTATALGSGDTNCNALGATPCYRLDKTCTLEFAISLLSYHTVRLTLSARAGATTQSCFYQYDGAAFSTSGQITIAELGQTVLTGSIAVPDNVNYNRYDSFTVTIGNSDNGNGEYCYFDDLYVYGVPYTSNPTRDPTKSPSQSPTSQTAYPTISPTRNPTTSPTPAPTDSPTQSPTFSPSAAPSSAPSFPPTQSPSDAPSYSPSSAPSFSPSSSPTHPTRSPTSAPTFSPSAAPSNSPTQPTTSPTMDPTLEPTYNPTGQPTVEPTYVPTWVPTVEPTTESPTIDLATTSEDEQDDQGDDDDQGFSAFLASETGTVVFAAGGAGICLIFGAVVAFCACKNKRKKTASFMDDDGDAAEKGSTGQHADTEMANRHEHLSSVSGHGSDVDMMKAYEKEQRAQVAVSDLQGDDYMLQPMPVQRAETEISVEEDDDIYGVHAVPPQRDTPDEPLAINSNATAVRDPFNVAGGQTPNYLREEEEDEDDAKEHVVHSGMVTDNGLNRQETAMTSKMPEGAKDALRRQRTPDDSDEEDNDDIYEVHQTAGQ